MKYNLLETEPIHKQERQTARQTDRHKPTGRQAGKQASGQAGKQTDRQTIPKQKVSPHRDPLPGKGPRGDLLFADCVCVSQSLCALSGSLSVWLSVCLAVCLSIKSNQPTSSNQRITQTNVLQASWCNAFADCCLCLASLLHVLLFSVLLMT